MCRYFEDHQARSTAKKRRGWSRLSITVLAMICALTLALTTLLPDASQAGWFGKKKEKRERKHPVRLETAPPMTYLSGTLARGTYGGWKIEGTNLNFATATSGQTKASKLRLAEGREVMVMGSLLGDLMIVQEAIVQEPEWQVMRSVSSDAAIVWSESDPTVGEGAGLPQ